MKDILPEYLEASMLAQELIHLLQQLRSSQDAGTLTTLSEWVASKCSMFREAFLKLVPEVSFYCRDYSVPLRDTYCKFTLCNEDQMSTDVYCEETEKIASFMDGSGSFFMFLDSALRQPARVENLPETEFFRLIRGVWGRVINGH